MFPVIGYFTRFEQQEADRFSASVDVAGLMLCLKNSQECRAFQELVVEVVRRERVED